VARAVPASLTLKGASDSIATMEADPIPQRGTYNQGDATGFIRLNALRLKVAAKVQRKK